MNDALQKLRAPAIGVLVTGTLNALIAALTVLSGLLRLMKNYGLIPSGNDYFKELPVSESQKMGYYLSTFSIYGFAILSLILAPVIIFGAIQMLKGRKYKLAKTAAILAAIPLSSCCFLIGIPFGIWAITVLNKPEVRAIFNNDFSGQPPPPPNF